MTVATARMQGAALLERAGITAPMLNAEVLLCFAMHYERPHLYAHPEQELREVEWLHYGRYLHQRMQGKPTQYITHKQEFFGRDFLVTPAVLIPRPETEHLVEAVLQARPNPGRTVDVGAGSGALAITLALESQARVSACDISAPALEVAAQNARTHSAPVAFLQTDLLTCIADSSLDTVVSNPPYVPDGNRSTLSVEVRDWEPAMALFAGEDGLDVYRRLIPEAHRVLKPGGLLALEFGLGQAEALTALTRNWRDTRIIPDLARIPRVLVCEKP